MSRATYFETHRIEKSRYRLQVSETEIAWLFAVDISAYQRWKRDRAIRFKTAIMLAELLETALEKGASVEEIRNQMGVVTGPDNIPQKRNPKTRTDEQRKRAWAFIASRAYDWSELASTHPMLAMER